MKKTLLFALILSAISHSLCAQSLRETHEPKRHSMTISGGVWESDVVRTIDNLHHMFGPVAAIDYQYVLSDYFTLRAKAFGGGIYNNEYNESLRHIGVSAGILFTPFGRKFTNFKIGFAPMYAYEAIQQNLSYHRSNKSTSWLGFEIPIHFYLVDNPSWRLGLGFDIQFGHNFNGFEGFSTFTAASMISYSVKF